MKYLLLAIVFLWVLVSAPLRADSSVDAYNNMEGIYPFESAFIEQIAETSPKLANVMREELGKRQSLRDRIVYLEGLSANEFRELSTDALQTDAYNDYSSKRSEYYLQNLYTSYLGVSASVSEARHGEIEPSTLPRPEDWKLSPKVKRGHGIPLTDTEKWESGLEDYNTTQKEERGIPLTLEEWRWFYGEAQEGSSSDQSSQAPSAPSPEVQPVSYSDPFDINPDSQFSLSLDVGYGQMDRGDVQIPIFIEEGGIFLQPISIDTGWEDTYTIAGRIEIALDPSVIYTPEYKARKRAALNFGFISSDSSGSIDFIRGGNAEPFVDGSALLDPGGLDGGLGGGGIKLADNDIGFADHHDVRVSSDYEAWRVELEISNSYGVGDLQIRPWGGIFYGNTDENITISGMTGDGLVDYRYSNGVSSDRVGGEIEVEAKYRVSDDFRLFFTPRFSLSRVWADADSRVQVDLDGAPFGSSSESGIDATYNSVDYAISGGVEYDITDSATVKLGGTWSSSEDPSLKFMPGRRANVESERYDAWTLGAGVQVDF